MEVFEESKALVTSLNNEVETRHTILEESSRLVVIVPGAQANLSGEHEGDKRYDLLAERFTALGAEVLQCSNIFTEENGFFDEEGNINSILEYATEIADQRKISGFGFSAGARMLAQFAHEYPKLDHLALVNPDPGLWEGDVISGIRKYLGTMNMAVGKNDDEERKLFAESLCRASRKNGNCTQYINGADHLFTGMQDEFVDLAEMAIPITERV